MVRLTLVVSLCLAAMGGLAGCTTHNYLPADGQLVGQVAAPVELSKVRGSLSSRNIDYAVPSLLPGTDSGKDAYDLARTEVSGWFAGPGDDYAVELGNQGGKETGGWTFFMYFLSLGLLPYVGENDYTSTLVLKDRQGNEVFRNTEQYKMRGALSVWLPTAMAVGSTGGGEAQESVRDQMNRHKLALGQHIVATRAEYERAVAADTVETHRNYLKQNPGSFFRAASLRRLADLAPDQNALRFHIDNLKLAPDYLAYVPEDQAIWFVGPEGLRVHDVLTQSRSQAESILAARIRTGGGAYKVFSADEIERLQESGLKPGLVAAMMEVSAGKVAAPAVQPAASAPVAVPVTTAAPTAAEPDSPSVTDIAAQCAKRFAAMQACEQIPSFGSNICKAQVRKTYNHLACEIIQ